MKITWRGFLVCCFCIVLIEWIGSLDRIQNGSRDAMTILGVIRLIEIIILLGVFHRLRSNDTTWLSSIAKAEKGIIHGVVWAAIFGLSAAIASLVLQVFGIHILEYFKPVSSARWEHWIRICLVGGVIGPVAEELFFRGVLFGYFRNWGVLPAVTISTLLFTAAHLPSVALLPIPLIGGVLFAAVYEKERSLWSPIAVHILGNLAIFTLI